VKRRGQKRQERKARRFFFETVGPSRIYNKLCWNHGWSSPWEVCDFNGLVVHSRAFVQAWTTLSLRWKRGEDL